LAVGVSLGAVSHQTRRAYTDSVSMTPIWANQKSVRLRGRPTDAE